MGDDEFPLGLDLVGADVVLEGGVLVFLQNIPGYLVQFDGDAVRCLDGRDLDVVALDVAVHRLVGVVRQGLVVLEWGVLVFIKNGLGNLVQFDGDAVRHLDGRDLGVVALDIASSEVVDIGVPEAGEAAEEEDVPDGIQVGLGFGEF